jgi:hypothetical protein
MTAVLAIPRLAHTRQLVHSMSIGVDPRQISARANWSLRTYIGLLPLMVALPAMYVPKLLEGDTQPWVFISAIVALFSFRTREFIHRRDFSIYILATVCALAEIVRSESAFEVMRVLYMYGSFGVLWSVLQRERGDFMVVAVRAVVVMWFLVGFYQYLAVNFGLPVSFAGRYVEGRSGVPSMTAEASFYGGLAVIQMMYLLSRGDRRDNAYIAISALSVLISGSLLAMFLLVFPFLLMRPRHQFRLIIGVAALIFLDDQINVGGFTARLSAVARPGEGFAVLMLDPSLNLRIGHIFFTLYVNFLDSFLLLTPKDFQHQYNSFGIETGAFIPTESEFILTALGGMVYGSGVFAVILVTILLIRAASTAQQRWRRFVKVGFVVACLLTTFGISNPFLILYILRRDDA